MNPHEYWEQFEEPSSIWYILVTIICVLLFIAGALFNILVIYYLLCSNKFKATSNRYFLLNLAISDLLKVFLNLPLKTASSWNHEWLFGYWGCQMYGFAGGLSGFLSITTLTFMTIERYLMVRNPLTVLNDSSKSSALSITLAWIYAFLLISLQFLTDKKFVLEGMLTSCTFDYLSEDLTSRGVVMFMCVFGFFLPLTLIVIFYSLLLRLLMSKARSLRISFCDVTYVNSSSGASIGSKFQSSIHSQHQHNNNNNDYNQSTTKATTKQEQPNEEHKLLEVPNSQVNLHCFNNRSLKHHQQQNPSPNTSRMNLVIRREIRVTRQILACVSLFCITWFPYAIVVLIAQYGSHIERFVTPVTATLPALFAKSSVVLNPILYTLTSTECRSFFRRHFSKMSSSRAHHHNSPHNSHLHDHLHFHHNHNHNHHRFDQLTI